MAHPTVKLVDIISPNYNALEFPWDQVCLIILGRFAFKFIRSGNVQRDIRRLQVIASIEYKLKLEADLIALEERICL